MQNFSTLGILLVFLAVPWPTPASLPAPASLHSPELLVVNQTDHSVSFIDPGHPQPAASFDEAAITGHEIAVTPDGRTAFVPIYGDSGVGKPGTDGRTLEVVDVASRKLVHTIDFGRGVRPHCAVYDRKRNLLYVTTELDQSIAIVDPVTYAITGRIPTGQAQSHMLALSHDGRFGYTANVGPGTVSVLDLDTRKTIAVIPVSANTQRIAVSADDRFVFTADQTKPQLAVIDTATNTVKQRISLPGIAYGTAPTPDGRWLLAAMRTSGAVALIDARTHTFVRAIKTGGVPTEILIRPDGEVAYVSCGSNVVVIDLARMEVAGALNAGAGADGMAWAN
jgi:YVTN family beta-propeller protein